MAKFQYAFTKFAKIQVANFCDLFLVSGYNVVESWVFNNHWDTDVSHKVLSLLGQVNTHKNAFLSAFIARWINFESGAEFFFRFSAEVGGNTGTVVEPRIQECLVSDSVFFRESFQSRIQYRIC